MPAGPAGSQGQRALGIVIVRAKGHALVQNHHDVGIKRALDFQNFFRGKKVTGAVQMGAELHALFVDFAQGTEAEDLKAAAVRKN